MMKRTYNYLSDDDDISSDSDQGESKNEEKIFLSKISTMMYTFGDVKEPLEESTKLMYIILQEQMDLLLNKASEVAEIRRSSEISHAEILFVLRKNKSVLRQLLQYLKVLDTKPWLAVDKKLNEDGGRPVKMKKTKMCMDFLASIEDFGEFTSLLDNDNFTLTERAKRRLERRLVMIECMKLNEYEEFSKALQVSFCQRMKEFVKWLLHGNDSKFRLTELAIIIISFLARETIAEVIDKVLLIKKDQFKKMSSYDYLNKEIDLLDSSSNITTRLMKSSKITPSQHLKISEKKEFQNRKPITSGEIREAFAQFNEPSPIIYYFNKYPVFTKKKLILAESFEDL